MLKIVLPWQKPNIDYGYKTVMVLFLEKMVRQWALAAGNSAIAEKAPYIRVRVRSGDWVQVCVWIHPGIGSGVHACEINLS